MSEAVTTAWAGEVWAQAPAERAASARAARNTCLVGFMEVKFLSFCAWWNLGSGSTRTFRIGAEIETTFPSVTNHCLSATANSETRGRFPDAGSRQTATNTCAALVLLIHPSGLQPPWAEHWHSLSFSCSAFLWWNEAWCRKSGRPGWCFLKSARPRRAHPETPDRAHGAAGRGQLARAVARRPPTAPPGPPSNPSSPSNQSQRPSLRPRLLPS